MKLSRFFFLFPFFAFAQEFAEEAVCEEEEVVCEKEEQEEPVCEPEPRWYLTAKPGYYYFTESSMREFFETGGFTMRGEAGCRVWGPLVVWMDAGYFQHDGTAIGGTEAVKVKIGSITLGLKIIHYFNRFIAVYAGAGPRLFMLLVHNDSPFVPAEDNKVGFGGGFDAGIWVFPFAKCNNYAKNIYLDFFGDYSLCQMKIKEDEISSEVFDIDASGITAGLGLGVRF